MFRTRYFIVCKDYTGYCGTSEIEHGLCACTVDNPLAKARGLSLRTGTQTMLYLSLWPQIVTLTLGMETYILHALHFLVMLLTFLWSLPYLSDYKTGFLLLLNDYK